MYDLTRFTLRDMTQLGGVLRRLGEGAETMEEVAQRTVSQLREELVDRASGRPSCGLVRFFKTHPFGALEPGLQEFAAGMLHGAAASDSMKCLTLLASAGDRPNWNSRHRSSGHRAIPLPSVDLVDKAPMISSLLQQLGVEVATLLRPDPDLLVEASSSSFNVFYVPRAPGSALIPAQEEFVQAAGIESVLGFGGMLPGGEIFAVILFAKVPIPRETAELFRTLALNVKMAVLPFEERVFASEAEPAS